MSRTLKSQLEKDRQELRQALEEEIEDTIRSAGPMNSLAWLVVVLGAFFLNLALLAIVTGG